MAFQQVAPGLLVPGGWRLGKDMQAQGGDVVS